MRQHVPPILLGGATFSLEFGVFRNMNLGRRHIVVQRLGLGCRATAVATCKDFDDPDICLLVKCENVIGTYGTGGLRRHIAIDPDLACGNDTGGDGARFEKPRLP